MLVPTSRRNEAVPVVSSVPLAGEESIEIHGQLVSLFIVLPVVVLFPALSIAYQVYLYAQSMLIPVCVVVKSHSPVSYFARLEL